MASHSSAMEREHTPHTNNSFPINDAVKRRAEALIEDESIDGGSRNLIRYALEINDPSLAELVLRVDAGKVSGTTSMPKRQLPMIQPSRQ